VDVDVLLDDHDVLVEPPGSTGPPQRRGDLLGMTAVGLVDLHHDVGAVGYLRHPHVGDAPDPETVQHVPGDRRARVVAHGVLDEESRPYSLQGPAQHRVVAVGDSGDPQHRRRCGVAVEVARVLRERALLHERGGVGVEETLDDDLSARRYV